MGIIERGAAIGFAVAAGIGTFLLGMLGVIFIIAIVVTIIAVIGNAEDEVDE